MIRKLILGSFGRFRDESFDFSPVTVFIGENESGKTTIFDAIFENICAPKGNTLRGRRLAGRYGDDRASQIVFTGEEIRIDQDEFLNLHAIGAGEISLDLSSRGDWLERVKSSIFTGGIDPGTLAAEFEKLASDNGSLAHMKKLRALEKERKETRAAFDSLIERKNRILSGEQAMKGRRGDLEKLSARTGGVDTALHGKEHMLEQQVKIREREGLVRAMDLIVRHASLEAEVKRLARFGQDGTPRLKSLEKAVDDGRAEKTMRDGEAAASARQLEAFQRKMADRAREAESLRSRAFVATQLIAAIDASAPKPVIRIVTSWNRVLLAASALPLAAGVAAFIMVPQKYIALAALVGGAVISLVMAFFARKTREIEERPSPIDLITRVRDEWRARTKEELRGTTLEVLQRELLAMQTAYDAAEREISRLRDEESSLKHDAGEVRGRADAAGEALAAATAALGAELRSLGVGEPGEYAARRAEYQSVTANRDSVAAELDAEVRRFGLGGAGELRAECELRAARLREEITAEKLSDADINLLRREIAALKQEQKNIASQQAALRSTIDKGEGEVMGSLGELPELIHAKETALRRLEGEIGELQLDRRAAAVVGAVFSEMAKDSSTVFAGLGADISRFMDGILPAGRHVALSDFDNGAVEIADAGGTARPLADLSTGTRDSFCLAARLALALRSWSGGGEGIIVLDEPFHSLDGPRVARALALLKKFHDDHGWQIVLFSKDPEIGVMMRELVPGSRVHALRHGGKKES